MKFCKTVSDLARHFFQGGGHVPGLPPSLAMPLMTMLAWGKSDSHCTDILSRRQHFSHSFSLIEVKHLRKKMTSQGPPGLSFFLCFCYMSRSWQPSIHAYTEVTPVCAWRTSRNSEHVWNRKSWDKQEWRKTSDSMYVGFFKAYKWNTAQWPDRACTQHILPDVIASQPATLKLNLLSWFTSSGDDEISCLC